MKEVLKFQNLKFVFSLFDDGEIDLDEIIDIKQRNIEDQLEELPILLEKFGILMAKTMKNVKMSETLYRVWRATEEKRVREKAIDDGEKLTEKAIEARIITNKNYLLHKKKQAIAEEKYESIKSIYWAIQKKGEVLAEMKLQTGNLNKLAKEQIKEGVKKKRK